MQTLTRKIYISPSRLAGVCKGNDGGKTKDWIGLWVKNVEIFWVLSMNAVFI